MPKFIVVERWYKAYEVEADSFEDAKNQALDDPQPAEDILFDDIAYITCEDGHEQIYS